MSIKGYKPEQIVTLLRQIEVLHLTTRFDPLFVPTTVLGFVAIDPDSDPY